MMLIGKVWGYDFETGKPCLLPVCVTPHHHLPPLPSPGQCLPLAPFHPHGDSLFFLWKRELGHAISSQQQQEV